MWMVAGDRLGGTMVSGEVEKQTDCQQKLATGVEGLRGRSGVMWANKGVRGRRWRCQPKDHRSEEGVGDLQEGVTQ